MTNTTALWCNLIVATAATLMLSYFSSFQWSVPWFLCGVAYAYLFEYCYHRLMHSELFPYLATKHRNHHRQWSGYAAESCDRSKGNLSEDWFFFPSALWLHFLPFYTIYGWFPTEVLVAFLLFYCQYEVLHWATHIVDNPLDELLLGNKWTYWLRVRQINWHMRHHDRPHRNFSFTSPYPGDHLFATKD